MNYIQKWTVGIIVGVIVLLIGWDCYAVWRAGEEATISAIIQHAAHQWPIIGAAGGLLIGHFFWQMSKK